MPELKQMLLVEPENILRRTAALTARSMGLAEVQEASSTAAARQILATCVYCWPSRRPVVRVLRKVVSKVPAFVVTFSARRCRRSTLSPSTSRPAASSMQLFTRSVLLRLHFRARSSPTKGAVVLSTMS